MNKRELMAVIWPRYSRLIDMTNRNAPMSRWLKDNAENKPRLPEKLDLFQLIEREHIKHEIDYLEFGVFNGKTFGLWLELHQESGSRFYGFDSFEGLPEEWDLAFNPMKKGHFATNIPQFDDRRAQMVKGWFTDTLPPFLADFERRRQMVIHLDADLYSSTLFVLAEFAKLLRPGDVILFDDFAQPLHVYRAVRDWESGWGIKYEVIGSAAGYYREMAIKIIETPWGGEAPA